MSKLEFKILSTLNSKTLIEHIMDFEYYSKYFPLQIKEVKIIEKKENEIITQEKIVFKTLVKNVIKQKSLHKKISENELITEIFEGPAKGTIVNIFCNDVSSGSEIIINVDLKLSLKANISKTIYKKFLPKILNSINF